jgi:hypothetical protein
MKEDGVLGFTIQSKLTHISHILELRTVRHIEDLGDI